MDEKLIHLPTDLPPGFRFHPSDEELIVHYLRNKVQSRPLPASIIGDIDLYSYNPWDLPSKAMFGEDEWYFFSPRDRKYPNGERPNRAAASGYWKATGTDKPIIMSKNNGSSSCGRIGVKKGLVFYVGRPPKGCKTDWIMNEYRLLDSLSKRRSYEQKECSMRLDEWVICRVRQRGSNSRNVWNDRNSFTTKNEMQNLSSDANQSFYGWPVSNCQDDISSIISSLTGGTDIKNYQSELFRASLKRKVLDDGAENECIFLPSPVRKYSGDEDRESVGEGAVSTTSKLSNGRCNINTAADNLMKEDINARKQFYYLDDDWSVFSETHQALLDFK